MYENQKWVYAMLRINFDNPIIHQDMIELDSRLPEITKIFGKTIYISGASGMIASYLVGYLIWLNEIKGAGISIYAGIRDSDKALQRFGNHIDQSWFHLISSDVLSPLPEKLHLDYIVHAASLASPQYYGAWPVETMLPNVVGTWLLLEHCRNFPVESFLFFSSGSVYGSIKSVNSGSDSAFDSIEESDVGTFDFLAKGNVYGESKRCGEALSKSYFNEYHIPVRIARIHHTYGPTVDIDKDTRVFSEFVSNVVKNQDIVLKSAGTNKRSFCYITDTIAALLKIMLIGKSGEVYNVGNPEQYVSIQELAHILVRLFSNRKLKIIQRERKEVGYSSSPEKKEITINVQKLKSAGWENSVSIEDGFFRTVSAIDFNLRSKCSNTFRIGNKID